MGQAVWKEVLALSDCTEPISLNSGVTGFCLEPLGSAPAPSHPVALHYFLIALLFMLRTNRMQQPTSFWPLLRRPSWETRSYKAAFTPSWLTSPGSRWGPWARRAVPRTGPGG